MGSRVVVVEHEPRGQDAAGGVAAGAAREVCRGSVAERCSVKLLKQDAANGGQKVVVNGHDEIFGINYQDLALLAGGEYVDRSGNLKQIFETLKYPIQPVKLSESNKVPFVVVGSTDINSELVEELLRKVKDDGTTLVIVAQSAGVDLVG